jgi:hypothetical protein
MSNRSTSASHTTCYVVAYDIVRREVAEVIARLDGNTLIEPAVPSAVL